MPVAPTLGGKPYRSIATFRSCTEVHNLTARERMRQGNGHN